MVGAEAEVWSKEQKGIRRSLRKSVHAVFLDSMLGLAGAIEHYEKLRKASMNSIRSALLLNVPL
ncbi:hypothetical protein [Paenibacillus gorillae]|uniref:hypothetical protein n=1 Tax=Paenibacillus gorillae TaxID=1243662 RepID=UPI0004BCC9CC|nr:hypothetical protein [Paenibacillus gorillae]